MSDETPDQPSGEPQDPPKVLSPAARRALAEAEERRAAAEKIVKDRPAEINGPSGEEPTRFGDWERNGITSDF
ncbi:DUF1674 domain-containing protein [Pyruvatibacter sp.]